MIICECKKAEPVIEILVYDHEKEKTLFSKELCRGCYRKFNLEIKD